MKRKSKRTSLSVINDKENYENGDFIETKRLKKNILVTKENNLTSKSDDIIGRYQQKLEIESFFTEHKKNSQFPRGLYAVGPPGTGKTALITSFMREFCNHYRCIYINCMSLKDNSKDLLKVVFQKLTLHRTNKKRINTKYSLLQSEDCIDQFYYLFSSIYEEQTKKIIFVFDEIDRVIVSLPVIINFFTEKIQQKFNFLTIGISNTLDFSQKLNSFANSRQTELNFRTVTFPPYTPAELESILIEQIKNEGLQYEPSAIGLCARKIASIAGDLRKALSLLRNANFIRKLQDADASIDSVKVTPMDVKNALDRIYCSSEMMRSISEKKNGSTSSSLPLHQSVIIVAFLRCCKETNDTVSIVSQSIPIDQLRSEYINICMKQRLESIPSDEFMNLCDMLEDRRIMKFLNKKTTLNIRKNASPIMAKLEISKIEAITYIKSHQILSSMLDF